MLNLEVADCLRKLKLSHSLEERVSILDVDVVVRGVLPDDISICIDVHGYQHFFRNADVLLGSNYLKKKLLRQLGYGYFEISLLVWDMLDREGKLRFLEEGIKQLRHLPTSPRT